MRVSFVIVDGENSAISVEAELEGAEHSTEVPYGNEYPRTLKNLLTLQQILDYLIDKEPE